MPTPAEVRDLLVKHLNANPLPGQEGRVDEIEGENAVGLAIDGDDFFFTIEEG